MEHIHITQSTAPERKPQQVEKKAPERNTRHLTPQMRALIAEECRARGCVPTARVWQVTVGVVLECRIQAMERAYQQLMDRLATRERAA